MNLSKCRYKRLPLGVGQADDAPPVGHSLRGVHHVGAPLVLQLCDLTQRLHRSHQAVEDAATLGVLAGVRWPDGGQSGHELPEERNRMVTCQTSANTWSLMIFRNVARLRHVAKWRRCL